MSLLEPGGAAPRRAHVARGRWRVFAATLFWGLSGSLARYMFRDRHLPPLVVVEMRLVTATLVLGAWLALRRPAALRIRRRDIGYIATLGIFGVAAVQASYFLAVASLGVGVAIVLQYLAPSLIVLYDTLRGVRVRPALLLAVIGALAGTALVAGDPGPIARHAAPWQWATGLVAALSWAFYIVFSKRALARYAPQTVLFHTFLIAAFVMGIVTPPWRIVAAGYGPDVWLLFLAIGLGSTLVPFALFYSGLKDLAPAPAALIANLEPVIAVLGAWAILGEGLKLTQWIGAALVLIAAVAASLDVSSTRDAAAPPPA